MTTTNNLTSRSQSLTESQKFIFVSRYARWIPEENRRENDWSESTKRYFDFFEKRFGDKIAKKYWTLMKDKVSSMGVLPSMRALWGAGEALEKNNIIGYNCSYLPFVDLQAPVELFYILMCGTGVGFSTEKRYIDSIPEVPFQTGSGRGTYTVSDSREGWATSLQVQLESFWHGEDVDFDYSLLRPKGARLKTMGGRSSGPEPLKRLHEFVRKTVLKAQGRKLSSLEWLDIGNVIGDVVVVGGVRRSSEINFSDLNDELIRHAKDGSFPPYRFNSNNSAVYHSKPDVITFMKEWSALAASGRGERGIFNLAAIKNSIPERREYTDEFRTNPCQPAFATILTPNGISTIGDVQVGDLIWSGQRWTKIVDKQNTGIKPVLEYHTTAGVFIGTENHRVLQHGEKIEVKDAEAIDTSQGPKVDCMKIDPQIVVDGLVVGDGSYRSDARVGHRLFLNIGKDDTSYFQSEIASFIGEYRPGYSNCYYDIKTNITELVNTYDRQIPNRYRFGDMNVVSSFLRGLYSANGSVVRDRVCLKSASKNLILQVQEMLSGIGIKSYYTTNKPTAIEHWNGTYVSKQSYDLSITTDRELFYDYIGFIQPYKTEKLEAVIASKGKSTRSPKTTYEIKDIVELGEMQVYDLTVEADEHTYWTGGLLVSNCGEIILRPFQFCNLSEVVVRASDDFDDLINKVKASVWIGAMQSTLTDFPFIRKEFKENCEKERLLGVSLTGQLDNPELLSEEKLDILKKYALKECKKACEALGINLSAAITTGKPSGTVSQLADCASGCHPRHSPYYIRRYRISGTDPLMRMMREQGMKFTPENGQEKLDPKDVTTWVCEFPMKAPKGAMTRDDVSAIDQLEWYLKIRKHWCEHNQSITVYCDDSEWLKVGSWVYEHFDEVAAVSFLPRDGGKYEQAPFEEITKERYEQMTKNFPKIDYSLLSKYEIEDNTTGAKELACQGGYCEIV